MEEFQVYTDIASRTNGEIYLGVCGPVRTGKSTFIKRFMELLVLPSITDEHDRQRAVDELPQSADGKTIMTTEPKFIPKEAVGVRLMGDNEVKMRLIDCVGYIVDGVNGLTEDGEERMVMTPWSKEPMPFTRAAEFGTQKVIHDHSTVGVVVTTDGSITELDRDAYLEAEGRTIRELKNIGKAFVVLVNSMHPYSEETVNIVNEIKDSYDVEAMAINASQLRKEDILAIMERILQSFPVTQIAFHLPKKDFQGFHIVASHSDSPTYRIKEQPEMRVENHYTKLNIERYGGMIPETWFDRPLSVAGRIIIEESGQIKDQLLNVDRDLLIIPNLAIHMSRSTKESKALNPQKDLLPLCACDLSKDGFEDMIAKEAGVKKEDILSYDLFLYNRMKGTSLGMNEEFVAAPKLDDLECAYSSIEGMLNAKLSKDYVTMCAIFDNEEVGSGTKQGAGSTFFPEVLKRICYLTGKNEEEYCMAVADSFMLSADNAHAVHPNYQDKTDPTNRPYINEGIVLKYNASQKYTTDANSAALVKYLCKREKINCQVFFNRSDILGGSTLGNILTRQVSIKAADIGLPQLSMHSTYETAGCKDLDDMMTLMKSFYQIGKEVQI